MGTLVERLSKALPFPLHGSGPGKTADRIDCADPIAFWTRLIGAAEHQYPVFLMDPSWPQEWKQHTETIAAPVAPSSGFQVLITTSGSTGLPKFCIHDTDTLETAANGYAHRFGSRGIIHCVNVLPQHHVGGLMPVFRSAACGGKVHFADYKNPESLAAAPFPLKEASLSVVPTQLRRLLKEKYSCSILRRFALILVGGAACPPDLLEDARKRDLPLAPCYGATETAAMVTAMDPEDFRAGATGVGTTLPHARIEVDPDQRILVHSPSLLRGYRPSVDGFVRDPFPTGDLGKFDASGNLHILGRADRVIITGGEKVHPEQVEAAALATGLLSHARCIGVPDPEWGQRVELIVEPAGSETGIAKRLLPSLATRLPSYAVPKQIRIRKNTSKADLRKS